MKKIKKQNNGKPVSRSNSERTDSLLAHHHLDKLLVVDLAIAIYI